MAISTYAELLTAAANWTGRADLTSRIPEFIALFEAKFNRDVRVPQQEKINASFTVDGEYETVPTDFIELRSMHITTDPKRALTYLPPNQQTEFYNSGSGIPQFVTVTGHTANDGTMSFRFAPAPDGTYTAVVTYYAKLLGLNGTTQTTNWLLTNHPDVYLYGVLTEAAIFLIDDPRIPAWRDGLAQALGSLQRTNNRARWGAGGMAARPQ
jgi:hypothetical protein